jgi:hypothetical protein
MEIQDHQRKYCPSPICTYFRPIPNRTGAATTGLRGGTLSDDLICELNELLGVERLPLRNFQTLRDLRKIKMMLL